MYHKVYRWKIIRSAHTVHLILLYDYAKQRLFPVLHYQSRDMRWRSWLRHFFTNLKVAGSIPYGIFGILRWLNPSGRTMALGRLSLRQKWVQRLFPGGKGCLFVWLIIFTIFMCRLSGNLGASTSWNPKDGFALALHFTLTYLFLKLRWSGFTVRYEPSI
jgi:hypothetical protein